MNNKLAIGYTRENELPLEDGYKIPNTSWPSTRYR